MIYSIARLRRFVLALLVFHASIVVWHLVVVANIGSVALTPGFLRFHNVFRIAAGSWTWSYRVSAALLVVLETVGCWLAANLLRTR